MKAPLIRTWDSLLFLFIPYLAGFFLHHLSAFSALPAGILLSAAFVLILFSAASVYRHVSIPAAFFLLGLSSAALFSGLPPAPRLLDRLKTAAAYAPWFPALFLSATLSLRHSLFDCSSSRGGRAALRCLAVNAFQLVLLFSAAALSAFLLSFER